MLFVQKEGEVTHAGMEVPGTDFIGPWNLDSFEAAQKLAAAATRDLAPRVFLACDFGAGRAPRYEVVEPPKVGDPVSRALNGDYYPDGEVTAVTKSWRIITTTTGRKYYRQGLSGCWLHDKHWSLVPGHIDKRNPEF